MQFKNFSTYLVVFAAGFTTLFSSSIYSNILVHNNCADFVGLFTANSKNPANCPTASYLAAFERTLQIPTTGGKNCQYQVSFSYKSSNYTFTAPQQTICQQTVADGGTVVIGFTPDEAELCHCSVD